MTLCIRIRVRDAYPTVLRSVILQLLNGAGYVPVLLRCRVRSFGRQTIHEAPGHTGDIQWNNESERRLATLYIHI